MPKYPDDDDYLSRQEIDDLRSEAKHPAKYMKAFFDFKIEARYSFIFGKMPDSAGCIHSDYLNLSRIFEVFYRHI